MTAFCTPRDQLHERAGVGRSPISRLSRRDIGRPGALARVVAAAFGSRADGPLQPAARGNRDLNGNAAKFPQRPLMLGDKWDF